MNALTIAHQQMLDDGAPLEALRHRPPSAECAPTSGPASRQSFGGGRSIRLGEPITNNDLARRIEAAKRLRAEIALLVSDEDGLMSEEDRQYIRDSFQGETTLDAEIAAALRAADDEHVLMLGIDARLKELQERKARLKRRDEIRLGLIEQAMIALGQEKLETPMATVSLRRNPPSVVIDDETEVPTQLFRRADPEIDKASIRKILMERHKALGAALEIKDDKLRTTELYRVDKEYPPIPGCRLQTDSISVQIRKK